MDKTIRRVTDLEEQDAETYRYWQTRPVGERLAAVCELSAAGTIPAGESVVVILTGSGLKATDKIVPHLAG